MKKQRTKSKLIIPAAIILLLAAAFFIYIGNYSRADESAKDALISDESVRIEETNTGWFFDGPSDEKALIFYPGGKVEAIAYAPLLHLIAEKGMDVFLVKMPFNLAFFGINRASAVMDEYQYSDWYIGGHSLGGVAAANYAAKRGADLSGVILLAAYPTKQLAPGLKELVIYGSNDLVLNEGAIEEGKIYAPDTYLEYVIEGGNHAQFGNYGVQKGDGAPEIPADEQQSLAADYIIKNTD